MKNVYDIKREENLNFILTDRYINNLGNTILHNDMAVVIHLHYEDTVSRYFRYIINIPKNVDIYITVSSDVTRVKILQCIKDYGINNCFIVDKANRGRDISALLVACRENILGYNYICFIHDKKEKNSQTKKDVQYWVEGLWENTIGSEEYIYNIKTLFEENENLGVLVPPIPITDQFSFALSNTWYKNFELTKKLALELKLDCDICEEKPPITLGTVFWCRVDALKKLFLKEWTYEDFPNEPLDSDGTISHAIERILAYVAQDAGYYTGCVMTDTYARKQFEYRERILQKAFNELNNFCGINTVNELFESEFKKEKLRIFCSKYSDIYIYGAGFYGSKCFRNMQAICKQPKAFLVSDGKKEKEEFYGIPIVEISQIQLNDDCGIILAAGSKYINEIKNFLYNNHYYNIIVYLNV